MDDAKVYTLLLEMYKELGVIKSDVTKIEANLAEHMRRTAIAENRLDKTDKKYASLQKSYYMVQGALALVTIIGVVAGIYNHLH